MVVNRLLEFTRDSNVVTLSGDLTLYPGAPRAQIIDPNGVDRIITLPDGVVLPQGGPHFYIVNVSLTNTLTVVSPNGEDSFLVGTEKAIILGTFRNIGQKMWFGHIRDFVGSGIGATV